MLVKPIKVAYIAGPLTATKLQASLDSADAMAANVASAVQLGLRAAKAGLSPIIPHSNTSHPDFFPAQNLDWWYEATLELQRRCDLVVLTRDWYLSTGARREAWIATRIDQPVYIDGPDVWERIATVPEPDNFKRFVATQEKEVLEKLKEFEPIAYDFTHLKSVLDDQLDLALDTLRGWRSNCSN